MTAPFFLEPHPALQPYVLYYVHIRLGMANQWTSMDMAPPGCAAMTVPMGGKRVLIRIGGEAPFRCPVIFSGQVTHFEKIFLYDQADHFFVIFKPHGAYKLLSTHQYEYTDKVTNLSDLIGPDAKVWEQMLADQATAAGVKSVVEQFFFHRLNRKKQVKISEQLIYCSEQIRLHSHRSHPVKEVCREEKVSLNKLERQMKEVLGISPKQLHRIVRFNVLLRYINNYPGKHSWAQVACRFGYYDQTHFIKEFKQFYGKTPSSHSAGDLLLSSIAHQ